MTEVYQTARLIGFNPRGDRQKDDYYATPAPTTQALLRVEKFIGHIWEPCCGEGHISEVLIDAGYDVSSSDLVYRGYGQGGVDALFSYTAESNIITNPPYKNALEFAEIFTDHAQKVALLLKLNFLEGVKRQEFFFRKPPVRVHVFSRRQSLMKNGADYSGGMMALAWFVWEDGNTKPPQIRWL
tara:strand:- start:939 stop:1490 length:552 start_codon:yes stop_codon:yes gene_type:complete